MQVHEIVVVRPGKCPLCPNPEGVLLEAREPSCGLCFGKVAITSFVVLHSCLGDEHLPIRRTHHIDVDEGDA